MLELLTVKLKRDEVGPLQNQDESGLDQDQEDGHVRVADLGREKDLALDTGGPGLGRDQFRGVSVENQDPGPVVDPGLNPDVDLDQERDLDLERGLDQGRGPGQSLGHQKERDGHGQDPGANHGQEAGRGERNQEAVQDVDLALQERGDQAHGHL